VAKLEIIVASTRPGRVGLPIGQWVAAEAVAHGGFTEVELVDLAEVNLPFMDEPNHPRLAQYTHQHTRDWSAKVAEADAFVFVIPEYNYGIGAPLKNALDYLNHEWKYKAASVVSYGGVSAGTRSAMALQGSAYALNLFMVSQAVNIPFVGAQIADGRFDPSDTTNAAATAMLDEPAKVAAVMKPLHVAQTA
jgi:NAD(P)H-dependent FMN reductase